MYLHSIRVLFITAEYQQNHTLKEIFGNREPETITIKNLDYSPNTGIGNDSPLLIIQHTKFHTGGCTLSVNFFHAVTDAKSFFQFMDCWCSIYRGTGKIPSPPIHDRICVPASNKELSPDNFREYSLASPPALPLQAPPPSVMKTFHFSKLFLEKLKHSTDSYSINDAICAFLWKNITKARGILDSQVFNKNLNFIFVLREGLNLARLCL